MPIASTVPGMVFKYSIIDFLVKILSIVDQYGLITIYYMIL